MTWQGWLQIAMFATLVTAAVKPLGWYIARSVEGGSTFRARSPPWRTACIAWPALIRPRSRAGLVML